MTEKTENRSAFIAAGVIMLGVASSYFFMPPLLTWLADISVWLSYSVAVLFVLAFFGIFWLRSRYQKRRDQKLHDDTQKATD